MNLNVNKGKISVIIPCYNQGEFLEDAVNSVLGQSYQNFEIIIINDGSTDKYTNDLLENYNKPKTKVYKTKNQGLASTRNYGFRLSNGEFIQFLDADDTLASDKFEKQINIFKGDSSIDVSYTNYKYFYEDTKKHSESQMKETLGKDPFNDFVYKWQRGISIPIHCGLFKRKVFDHKDPFISGFKAVEDWIMWVDISSRKCKFAYIDEDLAIYRIQKGNMTKNKTFMLYWVTRAISHISEKYISPNERKKFNMEQESYLMKLINGFFLDEINEEKVKLQTEVNNLSRNVKEKENNLKKSYDIIERERKELNRLKSENLSIKQSKSYRTGKLILWFPSKIVQFLRIKLNR